MDAPSHWFWENVVKGVAGAITASLIVYIGYLLKQAKPKILETVKNPTVRFFVAQLLPPVLKSFGCILPLLASDTFRGATTLGWQVGAWILFGCSGIGIPMIVITEERLYRTRKRIADNNRKRHELQVYVEEAEKAIAEMKLEQDMRSAMESMMMLEMVRERKVNMLIGDRLIHPEPIFHSLWSWVFIAMSITSWWIALLMNIYQIPLGMFEKVFH